MLWLSHVKSIVIVFLNRYGLPRIARDYFNVFRGLAYKYNKCHTESLNKTTPHKLRHTFCTKMANAGINPKTLQYIMGHSNILITLSYYAHVNSEFAKFEMERVLKSEIYYSFTTLIIKSQNFIKPSYSGI